jgi:hypothetical protein
MPTSSVALLLLAAAVVAVLHAILPDHWVPLAVVARTQRWSLLQVARVSALASAGHVLTSLLLAGIVAEVGFQFAHQIDAEQGHLIGVVLVLTGLGFLVWGMTGHGHHHAAGHGHPHDALGYDHTPNHRHTDDDRHPHPHDHEQGDLPTRREQTLARRLAAIAVPFGVAASPDLTILPVALAASALGRGAVGGVLLLFAGMTMATFIGLAVLATLAGYQIKGEWLERNATTITALVLMAIGVVAYVGI